MQALVAAEDEPSPVNVAELLRQETGAAGETLVPSPPLGHSEVGLKWETRWTGWNKDLVRLRRQLAELTPDDRAALAEHARRLRVDLDEG